MALESRDVPAVIARGILTPGREENLPPPFEETKNRAMEEADDSLLVCYLSSLVT
jgi:hypothetical protein